MFYNQCMVNINFCTICGGASVLVRLYVCGFVN